MSDHNPNFHNRHSIRLKGYDYSRTGLYFITLCVQNRERLFGEIRPVEAILRNRLNTDRLISKGDHELNGYKSDHELNRYKDDHAGSSRQEQRQQMILNDAGRMIEKWYAELENKYPNIRCHEFVVMPNHFHCIIEIVKDHSISNGDHVGSPRQDESSSPIDKIAIEFVGATLCGRPNDDIPTNEQSISPYGPHNKKYHPVIGDVVGWFKTMTTNEYIRGIKNQGWKRFYGKLWQRNYWESIIRDEASYYRVSNYIMHNPDNWAEDQLNMP